MTPVPPEDRPLTPVPLDRIELRGLRVLGRHGTLEAERRAPQPFSVDVVLQADLTAACASDQLADTLDYAQVVARVERVVREEHFCLLGALAQRIAEVVLADGRAAAVTVSVAKLRPPVPVDLASAGVTVTRRRPSAQD
jgi:dihydroneopterin aldolase